MANISAFAVHVLTASGAAFAFIALILATLGAFPAMFGVLGLALIVDGIDGPLARRLHVNERLPRWSGEVLDLVVDYLTYVFVPAYALTMSGLMSLPLAGRVVRGRIDAVYDLGGGRWQVVDWKTGREAADPVQLAVYRLAWARLQGVSVEQVDAAFLYVRTGREVVHDDLPGATELEALLTGAGTAEPLTLL